MAHLGKLIDLYSYPVRTAMRFLLADKTTGENIIWATSTYERYGDGYRQDNQITPELISGVYANLIQPRILKAEEEQAARTKSKAEVFTPSWVVCYMNNKCDDDWFGRENVFNTLNGEYWEPTKEPVYFEKERDWQRYVDSRRLEITCGEAPYLVSRYDAATGEELPIESRIGILDRKLRVVIENTDNEADWLKWTQRAFESTYGYEYQGDNLQPIILCHMLEALYRNTHGIIDQLVGLCMYLNLDYISSKSRPTIDADYINKVAKRHYRGIQKLMDELDDPLNEKKRQKIIEEADRKLDNLLQEHKQTAFAEKIMESAEADEKKIPLKRNIIHNIEMVVADYTSDRIAAAVDRVLISTDETDEKVLTRVVMKLLTDSKKETPTKKQKSKKKPLQTSDMVKFIIE